MNRKKHSSYSGVHGACFRTLLDYLWKEVNDKASAKDPDYGTTVSVARCYPMKNRCSDVMPFDK